MIVDYLALCGAIASTVANIPQVVKIRRPNSTSDLHACTIIIHTVGSLVWAVYAYLLDLYIMLVECIIVFLLNAIILFAMYRDLSYKNASLDNLDNGT